MKNIFLVLSLMFSTHLFSNCEYQFNLDNDDLPETKKALEEKGYKISKNEKADYELKTFIEMNSYDQKDEKKLVSFDVIGEAYFKPKKMVFDGNELPNLSKDQEAIDSHYFRVKIARSSKLETSITKAKVKALKKLDEKLSFQIAERLKECK